MRGWGGWEGVRVSRVATVLFLFLLFTPSPPPTTPLIVPQNTPLQTQHSPPPNDDASSTHQLTPLLHSTDSQPLAPRVVINASTKVWATGPANASKRFQGVDLHVEGRRQQRPRVTKT